MKKPARTFQDLIVWQKAHKVVLCVYKITAGFPKSELYGLTSQFRRAAVSVTANIAEGFKRRHKTEKARFLNIAQASLEECRYYIILAKDLGYPSDDCISELITEVSKLLEAYSYSVVASVINSDS
ncbi:MAG: four helix bundle protein [Phycisphaerae bacterium]